ncbi:JAB domain-containing protein [Iodobacter fluviatilis]|uniref:DNA repair protein RadC n=1 Tax=Iodobacter fluviatilis TaxID=537 RepID=A0A377Q558_9NEIS|nr:JAB domain-containing protein [Iodobacter fluviatilis]TCU84598.1 DNA repair protein RadC [Iodobacter fluviatilis]STQ90063.1 DNA repair protein RadC [Iodobacter fluviatilis]
MQIYTSAQETSPNYSLDEMTQLLQARDRLLAIWDSTLKRECVIKSPKALVDYYQLVFGYDGLESFFVSYLDAKHQVIATHREFSGTVNEVRAYPRVIARRALQHDAVAVVLAHCHPSGHAEPSQSDLRTTTEIKNGLELLNISVLDHIIVARKNHYSFAEHGLL